MFIVLPKQIKHTQNPTVYLLLFTFNDASALDGYAVSSNVKYKINKHELFLEKLKSVILNSANWINTVDEIINSLEISTKVVDIET